MSANNTALDLIAYQETIAETLDAHLGRLSSGFKSIYHGGKMKSIVQIFLKTILVKWPKNCGKIKMC